MYQITQNIEYSASQTEMHSSSMHVSGLAKIRSEAKPMQVLR